MIIKELLDIVADLNFWHREQSTGIARGELGSIMKLVDMPDVSLFITGVRRSGKTYMAKQILKSKINAGLIRKEQTLYVNFEDARLEPYLNKDILDSLYETYRYHLNKTGPAYLVFDELHNVESWEKWIRMTLEKKENVKVIVTGSGSKLIAPEKASVLTGRKITYDMFTLSFRDFLKFRGAQEYLPKKEVDALLHEYIEFGAFPLVALAQNNEQKRYFLQEIYDDIITKDIMSKYRLREELALRKVAYLLANSSGGLTSIRKIRNSLKSVMGVGISPSTLSHYLDYFEGSFLFVFVPIFSHNIKDQMQYPKKCYCIDTGILTTVIARFSDALGRLYENAVALELMRRSGKNFEICYWKSKKQEEVDFVVKRGLEVISLVQVCYDVSDEKTKLREVKSLVAASEELKCDNLLVITRDYEAEENVDEGKIIRFVPLRKWLLETS